MKRTTLETAYDKNGRQYEIYKNAKGYYGISEIRADGSRSLFQSYKDRRENAMADWEEFKKTGAMVAHLTWMK